MLTYPALFYASIISILLLCYCKCFNANNDWDTTSTGIYDWLIFLKIGDTARSFALNNFAGLFLFFGNLYSKLEFFITISTSISNIFLNLNSLDLLYSLYTCLSYRQKIKSNKLWIEAFLACQILQFGGKAICCLLLGKGPSYIIDHYLTSSEFLLAWLLVFLMPFDLFWIFCEKVKTISYFLKFTYAIATCSIITSYIDKAIKMKQSFVITLLCGMFSSCGGQILGEAFGLFNSPDIPSIIIPSFPYSFRNMNPILLASITRATFLSIIYYSLLFVNKDTFHYFSFGSKYLQNDSYSVILTLQLIHYVMLYLFSYSDPYLHLISLFHIQVFSSNSYTDKTDKKCIPLSKSSTSTSKSTNLTKNENLKDIGVRQLNHSESLKPTITNSTGDDSCSKRSTVKVEHMKNHPLHVLQQQQQQSLPDNRINLSKRESCEKNILRNRKSQ